MQVPEFLLRRLYVKGSLRNEDGGFAFDLRNTLGSGYADRVLPLVIDGDEVPVESAMFIVDGEELPFESITEERPMTLGMNKTLVVRVKGDSLAAGAHTITMGFVVTAMGPMKFDVTDAIGG
jgi:hypothetical protein